MKFLETQKNMVCGKKTYGCFDVLWERSLTEPSGLWRVEFQRSDPAAFSGSTCESPFLWEHLCDSPWELCKCPAEMERGHVSLYVGDLKVSRRWFLSIRTCAAHFSLFWDSVLIWCLVSALGTRRSSDILVCDLKGAINPTACCLCMWPCTRKADRESQRT